MYYHVHFNNAQENPLSLNLKTEHSFLSSCFQEAKGMFKFQMKIADPSPSNEIEHLVTCVLMYFPHETGVTNRPIPVRDELFGSGSERDLHTQSIMQVYWQNRLTPETRFEQFPFLHQLSQNLNVGAGRPACINFRDRLVGLMFFDRKFKHISDQKLKISIEDGLDHFLLQLHNDRRNLDRQHRMIYSENNIDEQFKT
jgi:hypothetical protein